MKTVTRGSGNAGVQTLWVQGNNSVGAATLTAANRFTNAGKIRLEDVATCCARSSNLTVTSGTLTNGGTIEVHVGDRLTIAG